MNKLKTTFQTLCVSECKDNKSTDPHQLPIYATSSFKMESTEEAIELFDGSKTGHTYSRYGNPTIDTVAAKIANLESYELDLEAYCFLTSSGMAAISTLMYALAKSGNAILTQGNLYGGTTVLFKKVMANHGVKSYFLNFDDVNAVESFVKLNNDVKFIYLESPTNPTLACIDLEKITNIARENGLITIIDNTFCTPYIQQPLKFGIDFVIHSTTKFLNGHGNSIAGAIIGHRSDLKNQVWDTLKSMGGVSNPWDAWLLNNGLKTLAIRMDKHCENAQYLAKEFVKLDGIVKVNYNGLPTNRYHDLAKKQMHKFGAMLSFELDSDIDFVKQFLDRLRICTHAPTLGDVDTLVLHPATSSHRGIDKKTLEAYGISDNLIRMSIGIEDKDDILNDVKQALEI